MIRLYEKYYAGSEFHMKRSGRSCAVLAACLLLAVLSLTACSRTPETPEPTVQTAETEAPENTAAPETPEPTPAEPTPAEPTVPPELPAELDKIRDLIDSHSCYAAFREILALEETYRENPAAIQACEELFGKLDLLLRDLEPASGTELARTFPVQGGCVLEVSAFSGPALVTVTDAMALMEGAAEPCSVRFYVRQGELGQTNLPAGTYLVQYQVGYRWFGGEDGFGEYCTEGALEEPLVFDFYMDGQWASNSKYTITL